MNKFCVDCYHVKADGRIRCTRLPLRISPVTGTPVGKFPECETERSSTGECGPNGTYYLNGKDAERKREEDAEKRRRGQYDLPLDAPAPRGIGGSDGGKPE